jgi:hypothetical protein
MMSTRFGDEGAEVNEGLQKKHRLKMSCPAVPLFCPARKAAKEE